MVNAAILDWLSTTTYESQQADLNSTRQTGTGQWFLECEEYREWMEVSQSTLYCPGIPGVGKTILTSIVVNDLYSRSKDNPTTGRTKRQSAVSMRSPTAGAGLTGNAIPC
ncbi:uncharacterized protein BJX67DRAFT_382868 [Aspergillus lucknowensis]|uniref:Nephrocystin 3-like N-terminal domain-containing protein n=1 Tax=Aspergillus lucknowensis TaxID=176173 RepID=A0ABR4LLI6_9EURO